MLVFQVNCPGCFLYAFPVAIQIHRVFHSLGLNLFALSTAFEDFNLNTLENTRRFIQERKLIGETQAVFKRSQLSFTTEALEFPVLFDRFGHGADIFNVEDIEFMFKTHFSSQQLMPEEEKRALEQISSHFMQMTQVSYTFSLNQFPGTPTWVLFDSNLNIIEQWFGHVTDEVIAECITEVMNVNSRTQSAVPVKMPY